MGGSHKDAGGPSHDTVHTDFTIRSKTNKVPTHKYKHLFGPLAILPYYRRKINDEQVSLTMFPRSNLQLVDLHASAKRAHTKTREEGYEGINLG